jgi:hypothetical protein
MRFTLVLLLGLTGLACGNEESATTVQTCNETQGCLSRVCVIQAGNSRGLCAQSCTGQQNCPQGTVCVTDSLRAPACLIPCAGAEFACPDSLTCRPVGNASYCLM